MTERAKTVPKESLVCAHSPSTEGGAVGDHVDSQRAVLSQDLHPSSQARRARASPKPKHKRRKRQKSVSKSST